MQDQDYYITTYVLGGENLSYQAYSDTVFKAIDVAKSLGLTTSTNSRLLAADPTGEIELSANLIITTSTSQDSTSKDVGLDVYRVFAPGSYSFDANGRITGTVFGSLLVRSSEAFTGKYFTNPIDLDSYNRQQFLDLILKAEGTSIQSLEAFRPYLQAGWQQDPFSPDLITPITRLEATASGASITATEGPDQITFRPTTFSRESADRVTGFDPSQDQALLITPGISPFNGKLLTVIPILNRPVGSSRKELKSYKKALKAQKKAVKRLGRSGEPLIYNQLTGQLIYDQNGTQKGFGSGGVFAIFEDQPLLRPVNLELG